MKKITLTRTLLLLTLIAGFYSGKSQIWITATPSVQCYNGSNTVVAAVSASLGATNYTWSISPAGPCASYTLAAPNGSIANLLFTCSGNYMISCTAMNGTTVITTMSTAVVINPTPTLTVTPSQTFCIGGTTSLTATGANTYTWSTGATFPTIIVTPSVSTCYSVAGQNAFGCTSVTSTCVFLNQPPTPITSGNYTVCNGSSTTLSVSATGATTFSWTLPITGGWLTSNATTVNFIPRKGLNTASITCTGSNGCSSTFANMFQVKGDTLCANVWPGDANRDGVANTSDVLELGLQAGATGATRSGASIAWTSQVATAWVGNGSTGWNIVHADCNGDGVVNSSDNAAITANFASTHAFKEAGATVANPDISLIPSQLNAYAGIWNKADIVLGDATTPLSQVYGVAFDVNYDMAMVQTDSVKIVYTASFLNANNQNIDFGKTIYANGKLYAATVRVDHTNKNGTGKIGEFWYKVKTGLPSNSIINLSISSAQKISATAVLNSLSTSASQSLAISANLVSILNNTGFENLVSFFPNPSNKVLNLRSELGSKINYAIYDITGREILNGDFIQSKSIELNNLAKGVYFVRFEFNGQISNKQLLIEN